MKLVIVTGMSGAGKSIALKILEDLGYFCVDNLPIQLMPKFAEILTTPNSELKQVALGIDVRSGQALDGLEEQLNAMDKAGIDYEILFLDAQDDVLVKRYKETRRQHPLGGAGHIDVGIAKEREKISFLKMRATYILDTSKMLTRELKKELEQIDKRLATLAAERAELEARLTQPLPPSEIADCGKRLKQGQDETEKLEERWLEISTALEEMGASSPA